MKKWIYLIIPGIMLGIFVTFYISYSKEREERTRMRLEVKEKVAAEEKAAKARAEQLAREDAAKKQAERDAEAKQKEDERLAKQAKIDADIKADTDAANADLARFTRDIQALESELERARREVDQKTREAFAIAKEVEMAKVARRNAELESQRMVEMISRRAQQSLLVNPPAPAMPAPPRS